MNDGDMIGVARRIEENAGAIYGQVRAIGGYAQKRVDPADLPLFLNDHAAWTAKVWGVTPDQLSAYEREDAIPRCGGTTKAGRPCGNPLAQDSDPALFAELHRRGRCQVHS